LLETLLAEWVTDKTFYGMSYILTDWMNQSICGSVLNLCPFVSQPSSILISN